MRLALGRCLVSALCAAVLVLVGIVIMAVQIRRHGLGNEALGYIPVFAVMAGAIVFVLPNIEEPSGLPIRGFGVTMLLGVGSGVALRPIARASEVSTPSSFTHSRFGCSLRASSCANVLCRRILEDAIRKTDVG